MKLYELTGSYAMLAARVESGEEITPDELAQLNDAIEQKASGIVHVLRDLDLDVGKLDEEIARLTARKKAALANRDRLRSYVQGCMEQAGVERIRAGTFSLSLADCPERVEVVDEAQVPPHCMRMKHEVNKAEILRAYKQDGEVVPGVRIERGRRLVVK